MTLKQSNEDSIINIRILSKPAKIKICYCQDYSLSIGLNIILSRLHIKSTSSILDMATKTETGPSKQQRIQKEIE